MSQQFDTAGRFVLTDFGRRRPFSSFLPGIAGLTGIPLWVFTVNRGQAIAAFGIASKDNPIMEFEPANKAYQTTPFAGFRTFIKHDRSGQPTVYEPFAPGADDATTMAIGMNDLVLTADNPAHGLHTQVTYFTLTDEPLAGLVRRVTITNRGATPLTVELLDGMARVMPFGVDNNSLKLIGRTLEAWMAVFNLEAGVPFYRLQASTADSAEVTAIQAGHFYLATDADGQRLPVIVDPDLVFGYATDLVRPDRFAATPLADLLAADQITSGKTPCGMAAAHATLAPGAALTITAIVGHVGTLAGLRARQERLSRPDFIAAQHAAAVALAEQLTDTVATTTGEPLFDAYTRQTFLDNVLRGGWPILLDNRLVYHVYSRKHGDLERDYNAFFVAAEPYSQGNGNYRDVNQNRRCDVLLEPAVGDFNIRLFMSLIQLDGGNPLVVRGTTFAVSAESLPTLLAHAAEPDKLAPALRDGFTPGSLLRTIADHAITLDCTPEAFLAEVLQHAEQRVSADFGEGYWTDHWTYNLDLIETYLAVYPEHAVSLFFDDADLPFYFSPAHVRARDHKYVLTPRGPRQYNAVAEDEAHPADPWARMRHGQGDIYRTSLIVKLLTLAVTRFAARDPGGMGIEMETGKPGWYDALNGLPGLFGSSLCEAYELLRLLRVLSSAVAAKGRWTIRIPTELYQFLYSVDTHLRNYHLSTHPNRDFYYWDAVAYAREAYRESVRHGLDGREERLRLEDLAAILTHFADQVTVGLERARELAADGVPLTYLRFDMTDYEPLTGAHDAQGRQIVRPHAFRPIPLPLFLEGPVHALKLADRERAAAIHAAVLRSDLYDRKLHMFKVNASLAAESHEIGRARAFTPGWLENESIWLHMQYKYLLELLNAGLHDTFFTTLRAVLIPFQDPERYGRSPLENSSFIVSSAHPDATLHGAGFVARLSGSTAEFLSIWTTMMAGSRPFRFDDDQLSLALRPTLPGWLFDADGCIHFRFLGRCTVTYHHPGGGDLLPDRAADRVVLTLTDGSRHTIDGGSVPAPWAEQVRDGTVTALDQYYD